MNILIAGGTGFIGSLVVQDLMKHGHHVTVLSRQAHPVLTNPTEAAPDFQTWNGTDPQILALPLSTADAVVNLSGQSIAGSRWSDERKKILRESRIAATSAISTAIESSGRLITLLNASAIGFYGNRQDEILTERSASGSGFLASLCQEWERTAKRSGSAGRRVVLLRTGIVLHSKFGALPQMALPFRFGFGGPVGSGTQWMSWIHYADLISAIRFMIEDPSIDGPVNLASPEPVPGKEFSRILAMILRRRSWFPVPAILLKFLFGEMASVLLDGQRVLPEKLTGAGFQFTYSKLPDALRDILL